MARDDSVQIQVLSKYQNMNPPTGCVVVLSHLDHLQLRLQLGLFGLGRVPGLSAAREMTGMTDSPQVLDLLDQPLDLLRPRLLEDGVQTL